MQCAMATIIETNEIVFENLLFFEREVTQPQIVKRELDTIMPKLRKIGVNHKGIVISKMVKTDHVKKTMVMQMRMPIDTSQQTEQLQQFFLNNPQYSLESGFTIKKGVKIVITNSEQDFRAGIQQLMERRPDFNMVHNPIIELSHISFDGKVLGFELFLEDKT